eukprot:CAMPEP_0203828340 /NCGR_PEP_ID=MMETSP0115-20131106/61008_1 /ASSEMBLY_ACC=CAM_ASM_000227 /TAXON_ID=33651 /ORGANISM="Bicosoecid sp, Strain ms1" /LENGTH=118 /DNA_ID=CAMNT_0050737399 /DNA_START=191 /DNA_END=543 /DNA_ORIENTATION=-
MSARPMRRVPRDGRKVEPSSRGGGDAASGVMMRLPPDGSDGDGVAGGGVGSGRAHAAVPTGREKAAKSGRARIVRLPTKGGGSRPSSATAAPGQRPRVTMRLDFPRARDGSGSPAAGG